MIDYVLSKESQGVYQDINMSTSAGTADTRNRSLHTITMDLTFQLP